MRDEEGLDDDVAGRTPRGLPRGDVDVDKLHLQKQVVELEGGKRGGVRVRRRRGEKRVWQSGRE